MARPTITRESESVMAEESSIDSIAFGNEGTDSIDGTSETADGRDEQVFLDTNNQLEIVFLKDVDVLKADMVGYAGETKIYRMKSK